MSYRQIDSLRLASARLSFPQSSALSQRHFQDESVEDRVRLKPIQPRSLGLERLKLAGIGNVPAALRRLLFVDGIRADPALLLRQDRSDLLLGESRLPHVRLLHDGLPCQMRDHTGRTLQASTIWPTDDE